MKKIAYIELDTHAEIAANFMELMQDSKEFSVDYYFSQKILKSIGKHHPNIFPSESSMLLDQLKKKDYDLVIIGTVHRYFNLFNEICTKYQTSVIVHNLNFTKISKFQLLKNIFKKDFKYRLKLLLKEDLLFAPNVFKISKNLLVLDKNLAVGKFKFLPLFFNQFNEKSGSEIFTILIPGAVSQERRDYKKVLGKLGKLGWNNKSAENDAEFEKLRRSDKFVENDFAEEASSVGATSQKVQVVFLGKAKGNELHWLQKFEKVLPENLTIKYFTEKVPQPLFDEWMNNADVLWCPILSETEFFSQKEIYGKTKMSGNIGDAIKYGKIAVFPEKNSSDFDFIISEKKLDVFSFSGETSFDFSKDFNKEKVIKELEDKLLLLL